MNISELVKHKKVFFQYAFDGALWYKTTDGFEFPVPYEETKGAMFKNEDNALYFMRWIRKHVETIAENVKSAGIKELELCGYKISIEVMPCAECGARGGHYGDCNGLNIGR
jgi:hypothetical protein